MRAELVRVIESTWGRWCFEVLRRVRLHWVAKALATMLGIPVFFAAYFWVLRNPFSVPTIMPFTALDEWVRFRPGALPLYVSLWVYVSITPALLKSTKELKAIGFGTFVMSAIGFAIFMLWPTAVPAFAVDLSLHPGMAVLKGIDVTANACPSLHVAFAVFNAIWLQRLLRETQAPLVARGFNGVWCLAILYSTLATRQHVLLDVLAGSVLGALVALPNVRVLAAVRPGRS
jgi:PAP2 superfamily